MINSKFEDAELPRVDNAIMSFVDYWLTQSDRERVFEKARNLIKEGGRLVFNVHKPLAGWEENYKEMLTEAYKEPYHNLLAQLSVTINSIGKRSHAADNRRYDELKKLKVDSINSFKMKYISDCLQKSPNK